VLGRTLHSNFNSVDQTVQRFRQKFDTLLAEFDRGAIASTFTLLTQSDSVIRDILDKLQNAEAREDRKGDQNVPSWAICPMLIIV
jgi:hypothetical protein